MLKRIILALLLLFAFPLAALVTVTAPACPAALCHNIQVNSSANIFFSASGGTAPYTWQVISGTVPGMVISPYGVNANGTVAALSGRATTVGNYFLTVQATDSTSTQGTAIVTVQVTYAPLNITNSQTLTNAVQSYTYYGLLGASGGKTPYAWSIPVGSLPPGLVLSNTGAISGTPISLGTFNFTTKVSDAAGASTSQTTTLYVVSSSPSTMWTLQPVGNGFQWVPPSGPPVCRLAGVSVMDTSQIMRSGQFPTLVPDKYPDIQTWANKQAERIQSWGFNEAGYASSNKIPLPFSIFFATSGWAVRDDKPYHVKQLSWNYSGMVCGTQYHVASGGGQIDAYDPGISTAYNGASVGLVNGCGGPCFNANTTFIIPDEGDAAYGINNVNNHEDLAVIVFGQNPMQTTSYAGGYTYPDHLVYAKTAARDFLANEYGCAGSADPSASNYCGATAAATALAALNATWTTAYTTWNTSDAGGIAGIHAGTYASYGTGTGFLDENGSGILNAGTKISCDSKPNDTWEAAAPIKTDGHNFVAALAGTYAAKLSAAYAQPAINPAPPIFLVIYDGPSYVYPPIVANFTNLGGLWISPILEPTAGDRLAMAQRIIANSSTSGHSVPIYWVDFSNACPDSYPGCSAGYGNVQYNSHYQLGAGIVTDLQNVFPLQDVNGKYVVVGTEHWAHYDQVNELGDGGLISAYADNPYDGSASVATATRSDVWQSGHTYALPSVIWDGAAFEATSFGADSPAASCVSGGGGAPTWASKMGGKTTDGTCVWRNQGPYNLKPESAARIPGTATLPAVAYGDAITPISNFLNAGICSGPTGLTFVTTSFSLGFKSSPYSATLQASGGTPPYSFSLLTGSLPAGLSLSSAGIISGTPTTVGISTFTARVTDSTMATADSGTLILQIEQPVLSITPTTCPSGQVGVVYAGCSFTATGGDGSNTWTTLQPLPPGLSINSTSGTISGTPLLDGTYLFSVNVRDTENPPQSASTPASITISSGGGGTQGVVFKGTTTTKGTSTTK